LVGGLFLTALLLVFGGGKESLFTMMLNTIDDALFKGRIPQLSFAFCRDFRTKPAPWSLGSRRPLPFPVRAFWHIASLGKAKELTWRLIVSEQVDRLKTSGVLNSMNVSAVFVGEHKALMPSFRDPRITVDYAGGKNLFEYPTLRKLEAYCREEPTGRVIYFHSKGSSKPLERRSYCKSYAWRQLMEHFTFDLHYDTLTTYLADESPYETAGALLWRHETYWPHYSGNFWIAKCSYINTLEPVDSLEWGDRMNAERWIGTGPGFYDTAKDCWDYRPDDDCPREGAGDRSGTAVDCPIRPSLYMDLTRCGRPPALK
jgi:hypothetical protein